MDTFKRIVLTVKFMSKFQYAALAGVTQWIEVWPLNQQVNGSIPSQGMCLG